MANEYKVFTRLYGKYLKNNNKKFKFEIGQTVRLANYDPSKFSKGYNISWTHEIFKIVDRRSLNPPVYIISDLKGNIIQGTFYSEELQAVLVDKNQIYQINVLRQRTKNKKKQSLVHWVGFPKSQDQWIDSADLVS